MSSACNGSLHLFSFSSEECDELKLSRVAVGDNDGDM